MISMLCYFVCYFVSKGESVLLKKKGFMCEVIDRSYCRLVSNIFFVSRAEIRMYSLA